MNLLKSIKDGQIPPRIKKLALCEQIEESELADKILSGHIVVPANNCRKNTILPVGIGAGLSTKINANIGTSTDINELDLELEKLKVATDAGADTIMDLSTGGHISKIRQQILKQCNVPLGTVPIYQVTVLAKQTTGSLIGYTKEDIFKVITEQAKEGVDFITVHCGVNRQTLQALIEQKRVMDVVSRGASFTIGWMIENDAENPLFNDFEQLLEIAKLYDVTLSLGDGMRPGCLADATDRPQIEELSVLGQLVKQAQEYGVQVMVEGPGHVPLNQIEANVKLQKSLCHNAPFYVLGPLVTDIAPGYDHITSAIGGALAASYGADYLCYVTPKEHLGLPGVQDVQDGVIASKIAAHAADIVKQVPGAWHKDKEMAKARKDLNWQKQIELSIDPKTTKKAYLDKKPAEEDACTMCGQYCAMKLVSDYLGDKITCH
ncbi:MAG: phosphomethylpyrimidine synthase ThiC [Actinobacteria bacterium]|nr:MAG: phosphomethylpyrimidine synthase ThiC [Actinomycetota bacterium]